ncbi:GNAT family N-acetyltransferase [Pseudonocardia charpentierae]|uniref:GNAT family N-acetyltransferase n=1 Tax=Pseudonocardia charpentierae TaxID=3075545 RepID=A0ABU2N5H7_9PSEU|nr:GNAT family N-acetyltransferase [Pseudonocardia sp. DSM 45834]MDT0349196.1 GNAT family N-acetyltransferase [Pseudonocardia sp. DSM 45834]
MTTVIAEPVVVSHDVTADQVRVLVGDCSPETLRRRFFLPAALEAGEVFRRYRRFLLIGPPSGASVLATVGSRPVGLLNLVAVGDRLVEVGLLVADPWQRRGIATHLLASELARPRWAGWTVRATVQADNQAARRLLFDPLRGRPRRSTAGGAELTVEVVVPEARR